MDWNFLIGAFSVVALLLFGAVGLYSALAPSARREREIRRALALLAAGDLFEICGREMMRLDDGRRQSLLSSIELRDAALVIYATYCLLTQLGQADGSEAALQRVAKITQGRAKGSDQSMEVLQQLFSASLAGQGETPEVIGFYAWLKNSR
ncbi:MAG: hypothetical protein ABL883_06760 [Terricaulis sp.]